MDLGALRVHFVNQADMGLCTHILLRNESLLGTIQLSDLNFAYFYFLHFGLNAWLTLRMQQ